MTVTKDKPDLFAAANIQTGARARAPRKRAAGAAAHIYHPNLSVQVCVCEWD